MIKNIKNSIIKYKYYIVFLLLFIFSILAIYIQDVDRKNNLNINSENIEKKESKIAVYITGEVKNPGVYYLDQNSRVSNAIDIAGGVTKDADINKINLAQKLVDSDKIVVPIKQNNQESDMQIDEKEDSSYNKININTASKDELMQLNGIGTSTADKIIEYRKKNKFNTVEDIMNVTGIGQAKFENIKDDICV